MPSPKFLTPAVRLCPAIRDAIQNENDLRPVVMSLRAGFSATTRAAIDAFLTSGSPVPAKPDLRAAGSVGFDTKMSAKPVGFCLPKPTAEHYQKAIRGLSRKLRRPVTLTDLVNAALLRAINAGPAPRAS